MSEARLARGRNVAPEFLADRARFVRLETLRLTRIAGAGHYSSTFSAAELFAALYYAHLRLRPAEPDWPDRDRFVLSKGHAAIGLYPVLADLGFFDTGLLDDYTRLGSPFGDHPDMKKITGVDFSSGSLGHGLSVGLGMALAGRIQERELPGLLHARRRRAARGPDLGGRDGGQPLPAPGTDRASSIATSSASTARPRRSWRSSRSRTVFESFGWTVAADRRPRFRGDPRRAFDALQPAGDRAAPQMIVADTVKGRGVEMMELQPQLARRQPGRARLRRRGRRAAARPGTGCGRELDR